MTTGTGSIDFLEIVYVHNTCVPPLHLVPVSQANYAQCGRHGSLMATVYCRVPSMSMG